MANTCRRMACLLCLAALPVLSRPAVSFEGTHDIRRPLVPVSLPSKSEYVKRYAACYPGLEKTERAAKATYKAVKHFYITGPDGWNAPLRIGDSIKALRHNPADALAAEMLGVALTLFHEFPAAIQVFEEAESLAVDLFERVPQEAAARCMGGSPGRIRVNLANTALLAADTDRAWRALDGVAEPEALPALTRLRFHWLRAQLLAEGGELDGALEELERAGVVELPPEASSKYPQFARADRREAAQGFFEGIVAHRSGDLERAEVGYRKAAEGGFLDASIALATVLAERDLIGEAIEILETLREARPRGEMMRPELVPYDLGNLRALAGEEKIALADYQQALQAVAIRSCELLDKLDFYAEKYCDVHAACESLRALEVPSSCEQYLSCFDITPEPLGDFWWREPLCSSLQPEIFVAAHNNFAMTLAGLGVWEETVERHLGLAVQGALAGGPQAEATLVPRANLVRTRWQRGDQDGALDALEQLAAAPGGTRVAAHTLWEQMDLHDRGLDNLRGLEAFVTLAERSRRSGEGGFWGELGSAKSLLRDELAQGTFEASDLEHAETLLASMTFATASAAPFLGPPDAAVTLVHFNDFACASCQRTMEVVDDVHDRYGDRVRFVFRQLAGPEPADSRANEIFLCAADQGKLWDVYRLMVERPGGAEDGLSVDLFQEEVSNLSGLDRDAIESCLRSGDKREDLRLDRATAEELGLTRAPVVFVNGRRVEGEEVSVERLVALIDAQLNASPGDIR